MFLSGNKGISNLQGNVYYNISNVASLAFEGGRTYCQIHQRSLFSPFCLSQDCTVLAVTNYSALNLIVGCLVFNQ
jgi:hypothetical protein